MLMMLFMVAMNLDFMQLFLCTREADLLQSSGLVVSVVGDPAEGRQIQKSSKVRGKFY